MGHIILQPTSLLAVRAGYWSITANSLTFSISSAIFSSLVHHPLPLSTDSLCQKLSMNLVSLCPSNKHQGPGLLLTSLELPWALFPSRHLSLPENPLTSSNNLLTWHTEHQLLALLSHFYHNYAICIISLEKSFLSSLLLSTAAAPSLHDWVNLDDCKMEMSM